MLYQHHGHFVHFVMYYLLTLGETIIIRYIYWVFTNLLFPVKNFFRKNSVNMIHLRKNNEKSKQLRNFHVSWWVQDNIFYALFIITFPIQYTFYNYQIS